ncbi:MAG: glycosyltransferase 87 family protein, partial [Actinomycetes bacterium]
MRQPGRTLWWALALTVGTAAFVARLVPVLRSGGLLGVNHYDAAVYFGSAVGLVHGEVPYRDVLMLHPPGIVLALVPFGALALLIGDTSAMAVGRLAWMVLGALSAVLVARLLRPLGLLPAAVGGLFYAVFHPAVTIEQTTRLEAVGAVCLAGALVLLSVPQPRVALRPRAVLLAGALLGFAATVKIWGVVPLLVVALYLLAAAGWAHAARFTIGAGAVGVVVCLPFLLAAPDRMWRYVVVDQIDRAPSRAPTLSRLADLTGLGLVEGRLEGWAPAVVGAAVAVYAVAALLAVRVPQARLSVVLLVA